MIPQFDALRKGRRHYRGKYKRYILKHAEAKRVLLQLLVHEDALHITVEDNGQGFVFEESLQQKSVGMKSLGSRVQYLKGSWDVDSVIGEGTTITFNIPMQ